MAKKRGADLIERGGRKSYDGLSDEEVMAQRLVDAMELEYLWQVVSEIYGKKVAKVMRDLLPADPLFFKDFYIIGYLREGKSEAEIQEILDNHTIKDWEDELDEALPHIKNLIKTVRDNTKFTMED